MIAYDGARMLEAIFRKVVQGAEPKQEACAPAQVQREAQPEVYFVEVPDSGLAAMSAGAEMASLETALIEHKKHAGYSAMEVGMNCAHENSRCEKWR